MLKFNYKNKSDKFINFNEYMTQTSTYLYQDRFISSKPYLYPSEDQ
jgi:hypothetical protein